MSHCKVYILLYRRDICARMLTRSSFEVNGVHTSVRRDVMTPRGARGLTGCRKTRGFIRECRLLASRDLFARAKSLERESRPLHAWEYRPSFLPSHPTPVYSVFAVLSHSHLSIPRMGIARVERGSKIPRRCVCAFRCHCVFSHAKK